MNSKTAAERAGITYRQLDHWIRKGYVNGSLPGQGNPRRIPEPEADIVRDMAALVRAGFRPEVAARIARDSMERELA